MTPRSFSNSAPAAPVEEATWLVAFCHWPPRSARYLAAATAPVPMLARPAAVTLDSRLAVWMMVFSCLEEVLTLVPRDLSTLPAILMASSMTLLLGILHHHLCQIVQVLQGHFQKVINPAVELQGQGHAGFADFRRGYSSPSPP